jgi:hypothetical protein
LTPWTSVSSSGDRDTTICVSDHCGPLDYTNWLQVAWVPACAAAGIPPLRCQSLRTANATAIVALAVDVKTAQTRAAHNAQHLRAPNPRRRPAGSRRPRHVLPRRHLFLGDTKPGMYGA